MKINNKILKEMIEIKPAEKNLQTCVACGEKTLKIGWSVSKKTNKTRCTINCLNCKFTMFFPYDLEEMTKIVTKMKGKDRYKVSEFEIIKEKEEGGYLTEFDYIYCPVCRNPFKLKKCKGNKLTTWFGCYFCKIAGFVAPGYVNCLKHFKE